MKKTGGFSMLKLFEENFGDIKNRPELLRLQKKYPNYNISYLSISSGIPLRRVKRWMEKLWLLSNEFLDSNFPDIKSLGHFYQRTWELYLCATLICRGYNLIKHKIGPDFKIGLNGTKNPIWIEAIAVNKGDAADRVPDIVWGKAMDVPESEMLLRLTSGLEKKYQGYSSYVQSGVVKDSEPYVIAINRSELEHLDGSNPLILNCLFGIGPQVLSISTNKSEAPKAVGSFWSRRDQISKKSGAEISMGFFEDVNHRGISAVLYTNQNIANSPRKNNEMGNHFTIVLNSNAKNPIPKDFFAWGNVWVKEGNVVKRITKSKENE